jgi:hypothetical protein
MDRFAAFQRLITAPDLAVEEKGKDPITCPNRMHVLLAAEDGSVVSVVRIFETEGGVMRRSIGVGGDFGLCLV